MKRIYFFSLLAFAMVFSANCAEAQTTYTKQIIVANGGDYANPDDYVTVSAFDPASGLTTEFATIYTQSVQDVLIHGMFAYVAAQDSIVKFNIETYEKVTAVAANGVNQLATDGEVLVASFWFPVTENFVRAFSLDDLSLITQFSEISGEAAGILINDGIALVAIPGAWGSTTGKIASIDLTENIVLSEDDYGEFYANIGFFAAWNNVTTAFMRTPWDGNATKMATFNSEGEVIEEFTVENASLANPSGQMQNLFYAEVNNGIGEFNLETGELTNPSVVAPQAMTIAASVIDTVNNLIYLTTTDFFSSGKGIIYNLDGDSVGSFEAGISAQAIAVDYRDNTGIFGHRLVESLAVYPNPATSLINLNIPAGQYFVSTFIMDISGKLVYRGNNQKQIDVSKLDAGIYFVTVRTGASVFSGKFIKK
ncbi:MAG: T9SS type A sorting domain-containing protein [Bacteroidales bacterium]|nr:T9SS type A sorting domain-containing protein [Bacteroidales bacterium]